VRIFIEVREMPFAGHPMLGRCAAWFHPAGEPKSRAEIVQECAIGLVDIDMTGEIPAFVAPPTTVSPLSDDARLALCAALKIDPARVIRAARLDKGPTSQVLELASA
jgi:predicted PhzF superfamily epimerase YddE/YHI9